MITDNASCFLSKEFKALLDKYQIRHWLNSKYHSQANPVERVNRTVNTAIRTYVKEDQRLWDVRLSEIETVLNTSIHYATKLTPYFVTHGYELFATGRDHSWLGDNELASEDRLSHQEQMFGKIREVVQKNLKIAHEEGRKRYALRHRNFSKSFDVGQLVYRRNMALSSAADQYNAKYDPQFLPARIVHKKGASSYELVDLNGKKLGIWPAALLKPG
ncbi:uncharacterized protein LOC129761256 [Toxorhynchites rutilus septentrionalis]|uniref:uncharacterized protein LOC129761256 n=1 Tax=Toxorhynchites rutilus septentrionalis TaxID=329112 RepID=UPI0024798FEB|nr:uncharacterized protein LOC129761256 [Toxorhynchites rutilus septentrionalis]